MSTRDSAWGRGWRWLRSLGRSGRKDLAGERPWRERFTARLGVERLEEWCLLNGAGLEVVVPTPPVVGAVAALVAEPVEATTQLSSAVGLSIGVGNDSQSQAGSAGTAPLAVISVQLGASSAAMPGGTDAAGASIGISTGDGSDGPTAALNLATPQDAPVTVDLDIGLALLGSGDEPTAPGPGPDPGPVEVPPPTGGGPDEVPAPGSDGDVSDAALLNPAAVVVEPDRAEAATLQGSSVSARTTTRPAGEAAPALAPAAAAATLGAASQVAADIAAFEEEFGEALVESWPADLAALEDALANLLASLAQMPAEDRALWARVCVLPWLLATAAAAGVACEVVRRRLRRSAAQGERAAGWPDSDVYRLVNGRT